VRFSAVRSQGVVAGQFPLSARLKRRLRSFLSIVNTPSGAE